MARDYNAEYAAGMARYAQRDRADLNARNAKTFKEYLFYKALKDANDKNKPKPGSAADRYKDARSGQRDPYERAQLNQERRTAEPKPTRRQIGTDREGNPVYNTDVDGKALAADGDTYRAEHADENAVNWSDSDAAQPQDGMTADELLARAQQIADGQSSSSGGYGGRGGGGGGGGGADLARLQKLKDAAMPVIDQGNANVQLGAYGIAMDRNAANAAQTKSDSQFYNSLRGQQQGTRNNLNQDLQGQGFGGVNLGRVQGGLIDSAQNRQTTFRGTVQAGNQLSDQERLQSYAEMTALRKRELEHNMELLNQGITP